MLVQYQDIVREFIGRHGIYALYKGRRLYYVGLASDLRSRLKAHLRDKHKSSWNRFSVYLVVESKHVKELESLFLRILMSKGNSQKESFRKQSIWKRNWDRRSDVAKKKNSMCWWVGAQKLVERNRTNQSLRNLFRSLREQVLQNSPRVWRKDLYRSCKNERMDLVSRFSLCFANWPCQRDNWQAFKWLVILAIPKSAWAVVKLGDIRK